MKTPECVELAWCREPRANERLAADALVAEPDMEPVTEQAAAYVRPSHHEKRSKDQAALRVLAMLLATEG